MRRSAALPMLLLLAGCAAAPPRDHVPVRTSAEVQPVERPGMTHYALALGESSSGGVPLSIEPPAYPAAALAGCPAEIAVPARVIVGSDGRVREVRVAPQDPRLGPFVASVRSTVAGWRYEPLAITHWAADARGESHAVDDRVLPFTLDYRFVFRCSHGHAEVTTQPAAPPR